MPTPPPPLATGINVPVLDHLADGAPSIQPYVAVLQGSSCLGLTGIQIPHVTWTMHCPNRISSDMVIIHE